MDDGNLAGPQPLGEVLGTPIKARHTADLGRCSAFAQQRGKSHVAVHPPTRAAWVFKYQRMEKLTGEGGASTAAVAAQPVTHPTYGLQRPHAERPIDLFAEIADVDLYDVGPVLVSDVPRRV
jgi:hypothetical protein